MRVHGSTHLEVFDAVLFALQIVGKDAAARKRFRQAGGWEGKSRRIVIDCIHDLSASEMLFVKCDSCNGRCASARAKRC